MRRLILAAAGLALLVPVALAQTPGTAGLAPPPPPPGGPHVGPGMMPPPPPPSRAAHLHLGRGDAVVDVKCADDESTKACAEVVNGLLDRLAALPTPAAKP